MSGDNVVADGHPRIGYLADGDPRTPALPGQLARVANGIELRVPCLEDRGSDRPMMRWFTGPDAHYGDDPDKTLFQYAPPDELEFHDASGRVALVGCHSRGYRHGFGGVGEGLLDVDFALPGASNAARYQTINGLRSRIDGLGRWLRRPTVTTTPVLDDDSRIRAVDVHAEAPPETRIQRSLNLALRPNFRFGPGASPDDVVISEGMLVETLVRRARGWDEHIEMHSGVRDLLRVASWRRLNFLGHEATRDDDPLRTMDGASHGRQWHPVETVRTGIGPSVAMGPGFPFLFVWEDIGAAGVRRWLEQRQSMSRAVDPMLGLLSLKGASVEAHWSQLGIGLEALGYLLARRDGLSKSKAEGLSFGSRLTQVVEDTRLPVGFDVHSWVDDARVHYRAVKHADRTLPDRVELVESYYRGVMLFRVWLAGQLGVPRGEFEHRLLLDRVGRRT